MTSQFLVTFESPVITCQAWQPRSSLPGTAGLITEGLAGQAPFTHLRLIPTPAPPAPHQGPRGCVLCPWEAF